MGRLIAELPDSLSAARGPVQFRNPSPIICGRGTRAISKPLRHTGQRSWTNEQARQVADILADGQWHHIAVTFDRDGNAIRYIDGSAVNEAVDISSVGDISNDEILAIGQRGNVAGFPYDSPFDGRIDDVRLYDEVLTAEEVSGLAIIPEPTSLVLLGLGVATLLGRRRCRGAGLAHAGAPREVRRGCAAIMPHRSNYAAPQ